MADGKLYPRARHTPPIGIIELLAVYFNGDHYFIAPSVEVANELCALYFGVRSSKWERVPDHAIIQVGLVDWTAGSWCRHERKVVYLGSVPSEEKRHV